MPCPTSTIVGAVSVFGALFVMPGSLRERCFPTASPSFPGRNAALSAPPGWL
jgi:hypothetical protein